MHANLFVEPPIWLALLLSAAVAAVAKAARWLSASGALAAFAVGTIVFGLGGGKFAVPLLVFFISSSLLSHFRKSAKAGAASLTAKSDVRDAGQVLANGGVACIVVLVFAGTVRVWPTHITRNMLILYLAALATVNADTWATELGSLFGRAPRLLSSWKLVPPGTSGAVTLAGFVSSFAGSMVIPLSALYLWRLDTVELTTATWAGFIGAFADSVMGAGLQVLYRDPGTGDLTERSQIGGVLTERVRGVRWVNNDAVNFLASLIGVAAAALILRFAVEPFR